MIKVWSVYEIISKKGEPLEWLLCWDYPSKEAAELYVRNNRLTNRRLIIRSREVKLARFKLQRVYDRGVAYA